MPSVVPKKSHAVQVFELSFETPKQSELTKHALFTHRAGFSALSKSRLESYYWENVEVTTPPMTQEELETWNWFAFDASLGERLWYADRFSEYECGDIPVPVLEAYTEVHAACAFETFAILDNAKFGQALIVAILNDKWYKLATWNRYRRALLTDEQIRKEVAKTRRLQAKAA